MLKQLVLEFENAETNDRAILDNDGTIRLDLDGFKNDCWIDKKRLEEIKDIIEEVLSYETPGTYENEN